MGTESWLIEEIADEEIFPSNYSAYRKDRTTHGGGVFLLIANDLQSSQINVPCSSCESVWCKIYLNSGETLAIGSYYRPPSATHESLLSLSDELSSISSDYLVLGGDFNLPDITWHDKQMLTTGSSILYTTFSHFVSSFGLSQYVTEPTRVDFNRSSTLDLLLCDSRTVVSAVTNLPGISDHDIVTASIQCKRPLSALQSPRRIYFYDQGNYASLADELVAFFAIFEMHSYEMDVETLWNIFKTKLTALIDTYIPHKLFSPRKQKNKPWINGELRQILRKKKRAYLTFRRTSIAASLNRLRDLSKLYKIKLKLAKNQVQLRDHVSTAKDWSLAIHNHQRRWCDDVLNGRSHV
ncbi:uncharacterized protein LOC121833538 [Ixodes scapularis]|uniref:uncharacterized protein LOC121833538 n=1 Tax=Ixodes scapularis TaxID=6945 RepID=UPI001C380485|nr:uncharacterized protein LOC121833538 [Ixodes scapularis]